MVTSVDFHCVPLWIPLIHKGTQCYNELTKLFSKYTILLFESLCLLEIKYKKY